jgi:hypothetical protein
VEPKTIDLPEGERRMAVPEDWGRERRGEDMGGDSYIRRVSPVL